MILRDDTMGKSYRFNTDAAGYAEALNMIRALQAQGHILSGEALGKVQAYYGHL